MARHAETFDAARVQQRLRARGLSHLRARKYGATVIVESGPKDDPYKHFRVCRDTVHLWRLEMAGHSQRWEKTPFRDQLDTLVDLVIDSFPWTLTDLTQNPERTSDREH
jgi:hypothetical protein